MDIHTAIVDMLRNSEEEEILNRGGPIAKRGPTDVKSDEAMAARPPASGMVEMSIPGYAAYRREAMSMGEPVMSPEEFKAAQRGNR